MPTGRDRTERPVQDGSLGPGSAWNAARQCAHPRSPPRLAPRRSWLVRSDAHRRKAASATPALDRRPFNGQRNHPRRVLPRCYHWRHLLDKREDKRGCAHAFLCPAGRVCEAGSGSCLAAPGSGQTGHKGGVVGLARAAGGGEDGA